MYCTRGYPLLLPVQMANFEYGEALELARRYGLDCDLVYQRQWQQSLPVTVAAIEDYLVCKLPEPHACLCMNGCMVI